MNNEDQFKNKSDQTPAGSEWAEIIDRRGQTPPKKSDGTESNPAPQNPAPHNRPRLPVIGPSLVAGTPEAPVTTTETIEAVKETSDAVDETTEAIKETSEATTESSFASTEDDGFDLPSGPLSAEVTSAEVTSNEGIQRRLVALLALFATLLLAGCFWGSMWWSGSAREIVDSPVPSTSAGKFVRLKGVAQSQGDLPDDLRQDALEIPADVEGDTDRFSTDEALVEQSMDEGPSVGSVAAVIALTELTEEVDQKNRDKILESSNNANSDPALVDAKRKLDSAVSSTDDGMLGIGDEENLRDKSVAEDSSKDPLSDSIDWNLAIEFHGNGEGVVELNGEPVKAIFLKDNAVFLLRKVAVELQRRVRFLENRLGSKVRGSIAVEETKYRFDDLSELDAAVDKMEEHISKLDAGALPVVDLKAVRLGYRAEIFRERNKFESISLADKNLTFCTEDETLTISSILSATEGVLRDLAKESLERAEHDDLLATESKLKNRIKPKAFEHFANGGALIPPDPKNADPSVAGIQNLGPSELQRLLQDAPSVDLFRSADEFQQAKDFVYSNGPLEMKIQLSIDKIDRRLNDKTIVLTKAVKNSLRAKRARKVRDLKVATPEGRQNEFFAALRAGRDPGFRVEMARRRSFGDGMPLEPLKEALAKRTDLRGLPFVMGEECRCDADERGDLSQVSVAVGRTIAGFGGSPGSRDATQNDAYRNLSIKKKVADCMRRQADNPSSQKLKTIDQILQIDHPRLRLDMIGALRKSGSEAAVKLMVNKAKFDLQPEVRIAATDGLAEADPEEVRGPLLDGLKHPWHVVAEHSAEALARLDDQDAVATLIEMLDLPHPHSPFKHNGELVQHELVGINHLRNCLLCHAPSTHNLDSVRALVPRSSSPLPPSFYDTRGGVADVPYAVRADVTYLEQDFSVVQPVKDSAPWPSDQRIDYVVRKKRLTRKQANKVLIRLGKSPNRNRNAIVFALQELTGKKPADNSSGNWKEIAAGRDQDGG